MFQVKNSLWGRGQRKKIGKVLFLVAVVFGAALFLRPVSANAEDYDHITHIVIDSAGIHYPDGFPQDTARYDTDTRTLTLDNYDNNAIEINSVGGTVTIALEGSNTIRAQYRDNDNAGIRSSYDPLIIRGQGSLNLVADDSDCKGVFVGDNVGVTVESGTIVATEMRGFYQGDYVVNGGKMTLDEASFSVDSLVIRNGEISVNDGRFSSDFFQMNGGSVDILGRANIDIFILNKGEFNLDNDNDERGSRIKVFNQNSGDFTDRNCAGLGAYYMVFNGGSTSIECEEAAILISFEDEEDMVGLADRARALGAQIPAKGLLEINGGDIELAGGDTAIAVWYYLEEAGASYPKASDILVISDKMVREPLTDFQSFYMDYDGDAIVIYAFSDGNGDIDIKGEDELENLLTRVHIYEGSEEGGDDVVPGDADDKGDVEVPNTTDLKIAGLAVGTLFAIIAEGVIITDLYRRVFGYKKEIIQMDMGDEETDSTPGEA